MQVNHLSLLAERTPDTPKLSVLPVEKTGDTAASQTHDSPEEPCMTREILEEILAGLGSSGLTDPDSVPEIPDHPVNRPGDVWLLAAHRIGCGDSTNAANVAPVLAGGDGPAFLPRLPSPRRLSHLRAEPVGDDVLLEAYVHET